jgi:hypothetical protein
MPMAEIVTYGERHTEEEFVRVRIAWRYGEQMGVYEDPQGSGSCWTEDGLLDDFMWTDGNYSCDCNRSRFFGLGEFPCGESIEIMKIEMIGQ